MAENIQDIQRRYGVGAAEAMRLQAADVTLASWSIPRLRSIVEGSSDARGLGVHDKLAIHAVLVRYEEMLLTLKAIDSYALTCLGDGWHTEEFAALISDMLGQMRKTIARADATKESEE